MLAQRLECSGWDAGNAVEGLSVSAQEALLSSRQVAQQAPDLARRLRAVLDRRRGGDTGGGRGYEQGLVGSVFELHAFNSDGLQKRSKVRRHMCHVSLSAD